MEEQEPPCECEQPGWCKRYQLEQQELPWNICRRGDNASNRYRRKWRLKLLQDSGDGPSLARRTMNFAQAMARAATTGFQKVSPEVMERRQVLCDSCEFNNHERGICIHPACGCAVKRDLRGGMGRISKLELATESCPLSKWGAETCP